MPVNIPRRKKKLAGDKHTTKTAAVVVRREGEALEGYRARVALVLTAAEHSLREDGKRQPIRVVAHYNELETRAEVRVTTWDSFVAMRAF